MGLDIPLTGLVQYFVGYLKVHPFDELFSVCSCVSVPDDAKAIVLLVLRQV